VNTDVGADPGGTSGGGPLAGVRVLEAGAIIAGPYSASLLAELGADVVKVESPDGDPFRSFGPMFGNYNLGKRGIVLDLRSEEGARAFRSLAATTDIVVDNFRPGVLHRLGIDYSGLVEVNADIVTVSVTGFGEGGPLAAEPGFDPVLQAMSGMMKAQGGDDDPVFFTVPVNDVASAVAAALGACLALWHRARTGRGQRVWTSLAGNAAVMQSGELVRYQNRPSPLRGGRDFLGPSPDDRFVAAADGWVRVQSVPGGLGGLGRKLGGMTTAAALDALAAAGIPAARARRLDDLPDDAELIAYEVLLRHERENQPPFWTAGRFARFSRTERGGVASAPALGEHTDEVLRSWLGPDVGVHEVGAESAPPVREDGR
jgi:crotonobetainyl-CoA:carnitine CoA-transferase CaiB-like acyl-CoA transferase